MPDPYIDNKHNKLTKSYCLDYILPSLTDQWERASEITKRVKRFGLQSTQQALMYARYWQLCDWKYCRLSDKGPILAFYRKKQPHRGTG
jgi:hypothetical protein